MKTIRTLATVFACTLILTGCGDSSWGTASSPTQSDIERGWEATQAILDDATTVRGQALTAVDIPMDFDYDCPAGGSAHFVGHAAANIIYEEADADFSYDVAFDGCSVHGVVIDGSIAYARTAEMRAGEVSTTLTWSGSLTWSGDVNADCVIDVSGSTNMTMSTAGFSYDSTLEGSVCGEDASHTISWSF